MGSWIIQIDGVGCHHNTSYENDANLMAANFVEKLEAAGHSVRRAEFIQTGQVDDILGQYEPTGLR